MLATINLLVRDVGTFTTEAGTALQPQEANAPHAEFGKALQSRFDAATEVEFADGINLPPVGNDLPPDAELPIFPAATDFELADFEPADFEIETEWSEFDPTVGAEIAPLPALPLPGFSAATADSKPTLMPGLAAIDTGLSPQPVVTATQVVATHVTATQAAVVNLSSSSRGHALAAGTISESQVPVANTASTLLGGRSNLEQPHPAQTSLPDPTLAGLAPQASLPSSRIVGVPTELPPADFKPQLAKVLPSKGLAATLVSASAAPTQLAPVTFHSAGEASGLTAASAASQPINTPVQLDAWGDKISERVLLMAGNQLKTASIRLTPADLGPLQVKVSMDEGNASVMFQAQHASTREALEMAMPRLRAMLAENGISLGQTNIGEQGVAEGGRDKDAGASLESLHAATNIDDDATDIEISHSRRAVASRGLVDTFA